MSDTLKMSLFCNASYSWYHFDVDFAALREHLATISSSQS
jgi:hypothetical protein